VTSPAANPGRGAVGTGPAAQGAGANPSVAPDPAAIRPPMVTVPETLDGRRVRLEPLSLERHEEGLMAVGLDPALWRWTVSRPASRADLRAYLEKALAEQAAGVALPFATIDKTSGRVAGSTRFGNISRHDRRVEIGWTWLGTAFQRSHVNTEAKYLMLRHAFETWGCVRVELKANALNDASRRAMERFGATFEGTLRRHMRLEDGTWRDTVFYSVLDSEWPAVRARLEAMMAR
jgi:RimJ/RimL family protein N-acetyltransferase